MVAYVRRKEDVVESTKIMIEKAQLALQSYINRTSDMMERLGRLSQSLV